MKNSKHISKTQAKRFMRDLDIKEYFVYTTIRCREDVLNLSAITVTSISISSALK